MGFEPASDILSKYTVLDLTRVRSGPTCVRQLADWGANVIKIEAPSGTDMGGKRDGSDFQNLHRNKRSLVLDLKSEDGRKDYKALLERYDGHSSKETRINEAKSLIKTLQYRNERSMPFERFTEKLQRAIDDLAMGGRPMHNDDIVDLIWPKICGSPNTMESRPLATRIICRTAC